MERESGSTRRLALIGVLALLAINAAINVILDVVGVWPGLHLALEILTAVVGMGAATALWIGWRKAERCSPSASGS